VNHYFLIFFLSDENLYYSVSFDGHHWTVLNYNQPVLKTTVSGTSIRDPYMHLGPDGIYHLVSTNGAGFGDTTTILYWSTTDLVKFSEEKVLNVMGSIQSVENVWAPEWAYDSNTKQYLVFWAARQTDHFINDTGCTNTNQNRFKFWYSYTPDFVTLTPPLILWDPGCNLTGDGGIDGTLLQDPTTKLWTMIYKDARGSSESVRGIRKATSVAILGPYVNVSDFISPTLVEGPEVIQFQYPTSQNQWYLYYDCSFYGTPTGWPRPPYGLSLTQALQGTYNTVQGSCTAVGPQVFFPPGATHGSFVCLTKSQVVSLVNYYEQ